MKLLPRCVILLTITLLAGTLLAGGPLACYGEQVTTSIKEDKIDNKLPTTVTAEQLELNTKNQTFRYEGNVVLLQDTMRLTCDTLDGSYSETNEITEVVARGNVIITKGETLEAHSERADFDNEKQIAILTDNPRVIRGKSELHADTITVYLVTEKTVAEGQVQMKIVQEKDSTTKSQ